MTKKKEQDIKGYEPIGYVAASLSVISYLLNTTFIYLKREFSLYLYVFFSVCANTLWVTYGILVRRIPVIISATCIAFMALLILLYLMTNEH